MQPPGDPLTAGDEHEYTRRAFLRTTAGVAGALTLDLGRPNGVAAAVLPMRLEPSSLLGACTRVDGPAILAGAVWYEAPRENDGLAFRFEAGALAEMRFLSADIFADSPELPVFQLRLREGKTARHSRSCTACSRTPRRECECGRKRSTRIGGSSSAKPPG